MPATLRVTEFDLASEEAEGWRKAEVLTLPEPDSVEGQLENPAFGLVCAVVLSGMLWTILIFGGCEVWKFLR